jgi:predicted Zn-dependent peptidase
MRWFGALLLTLIVAAVLGGATCAATESPPTGFQSFERVNLPNGLRTLVGKPLRIALFSEVLLVVRAGTGTPASGQEEIAWIVAEALTAARRSPEAPPVRLELARLGISLDFTVGREVAVFRFAVPTLNTFRFLHLLADLLDRRTLLDEVWDEAIARRRQELTREQADPWQRATSQLISLIWKSGPEAPVARPIPLPIGSETIEHTALAAFWDHAYVPGNMVLSIWGALPTDELTRSVQHEFGRLVPSHGAKSVVLPAEPVRTRGGGVSCLQQAGASPAALLVGVGTEVNGDRAFYAWQIAAHILGASYNSRLQRRLRTEAQMVYTVEAASVPIGTRGMTLRVAFQTDRVGTTRKIILEELRRLTNEPVTQKELDHARALLHSRLKLDGTSFRDQFYRRSLALLSLQGVRDPSGAEAILAGFTPRTLLDFLSPTLKLEEVSTVVVSIGPEPLCEGSHETKP